MDVGYVTSDEAFEGQTDDARVHVDVCSLRCRVHSRRHVSVAYKTVTWLLQRFC